MKRSHWLNLPNLITMARVAAIPVLVVMLYLPEPGWSIAAGVLFALVGFSDFLDGWLARRLAVVTSLGQFLDPLADKLLIAAMLVMLVDMGRLPAWMAVVVIMREICVTGLRAMAAEHNFRLPSDAWGKLKTTLQIAAVCALILHYPLVLGVSLHQVGLYLMWAVLVLTVWSGGRYARRFQQLFPW